MGMQLRRKIRVLRNAPNISQEVLAQFLGVSFQAVSKWENETAMPDITLIPAIASFFDISTDDLFDYNRLEVERRVFEICNAAYAFRFSNPAKSEAILRDGLKQYPGNDVILNNILCVLEPVDRSEEIITICKTLIEGTRDDEVKYDAFRILADTYHQTGQQALVEPTLEQIPEIYFTKLQQMAFLLEGDKSLDAARKQMGLSLDETVDMLLIMRDRLLEKGEDTEASKYTRIAKGILEVFQREEGEIFETSNFYRYDKEMLEKL